MTEQTTTQRRPQDSSFRAVSERTLPDLSVVIPVFNEEENISELYARLTSVLAGAGTYELLFVENGSWDKSANLLSGLREKDQRVKILSLSRNFGHQGAVTAGLDYCNGGAVIIMDGDLQDPPELLPEMLSLWKGGYEVVYAVRQNRRDSFARRASYYAFYRTLRSLSNIDIPPDAGDFCLMDQRVVKALRSLPERNRFTRGLRVWVGFRHTALPYDRAARQGGESKYSWGDYIHFALDGMLAFSALPLRLATYLGFLTFILAVGYLIFALAAKLSGANLPPGWTSTIALILLMGSAQLIVLGVLGEYVARIYDESKRRPTYVVSDYQG